MKFVENDVKFYQNVGKLSSRLSNILSSCRCAHVNVIKAQMNVISRLQEALQFQDFTKFQLIKPRLLEVVDKMLAEDIANLMAMIPLEENVTVTDPIVKGRV